ncbi:MAG: hypothetical protein GTO22_20105, partial [Gemmatimonadales bacterium]|nr:hypothetical protein [Gemmatimonadales bacterium]
MRLLRSGWMVLCLLCLCLPRSVAAQETRDEMLTRAMTAYNDFEAERARELLLAALDPAAGPPDSLWAQGVQLLAQILFEDGEEELAATWLRWATRLAPAMHVDRLTFLPEVVAAVETARRVAGGRTPGDEVARTRWSWPPPGSTDTLGVLAIEISAQPVRALVERVGLLRAGRAVSLPPGSYEIQAAADGFLTAVVTREVLPGVTTSLAFDLLPVAAVVEAEPRPTPPDSVLPEEVRLRSLGQLARLSVHRFGSEPGCAAGVFVGREGLLLTTYHAIRGAQTVEVELASGRRISQGVMVADYDVGRNVAVIRVPAPRTDSLVLARDITEGQFAWGLGYPECGNATMAEFRVTAWRNRPRGMLELSDSLPGGGQGGPVIDRTGAVIGLGVSPRSAVPVTQADNTLQQARRNVRVQQLLAASEVARRERHLYGSVAISSSMVGVMARIVPLESWQWPETARTGLLPLTYVGPMGRYQLELVLDQQVLRRTELTVRSQIADQLSVPVEALPQPAQVAITPKKGKFPWPIALLGVAGAGAAVALLAGGGGDGGEQPGPGPGPEPEDT